MCTFKNLCYVPHEKKFIFTLSIKSILSGVRNINDLKTRPVICDESQWVYNEVNSGHSGKCDFEKESGNYSAWFYSLEIQMG